MRIRVNEIVIENDKMRIDNDEMRRRNNDSEVELRRREEIIDEKKRELELKEIEITRLIYEKRIEMNRLGGAQRAKGFWKAKALQNVNKDNKVKIQINRCTDEFSWS